MTARDVGVLAGATARVARDRRRRRRAATTALVLAAGVCVGGGLARAPLTVAQPAGVPVAVWETTGDATQLLAPQPGTTFEPGSPPPATPSPPPQSCLLVFCSGPTGPPPPVAIAVDDTQRLQQIDGFGAAMTDSSAYVLMHDMSAAQRAAVMTRLFDPVNGIGLDYLRIPVGANDFSTADYTEDDVPAGQTDPGLAHFSIAHDLADLVPVLKEALAINPAIRILASPWSAPAWMKTSGSLEGGTLEPGAFAVYASYLVKYVQAYAAQGIRITAMTVENEPDDPETSYPGMTLSPDQEAELIPLVGQDLRAAGLSTELLGFDSDWSDAAYAASLLAAPTTASYLAGIAFHCYAGDPSAQLAIEAADPGKGIYETECSGTDAYPSFAGNLVVATHNLLIDAIRDYSKTVVLWNVALDQDFGPTNHGCPNCVPNVTVDSDDGTATYNVEHYILGQVSKFVEPGAFRVASTDLGSGSVETVAFANPDGTDVLLALNSNSAAESVVVAWQGESFTYTIPAGAVQTFTWRAAAGPAVAPRVPRPRAALVVLLTCARTPSGGDRAATVHLGCTTRNAPPGARLTPQRQVVHAVLGRGRLIVATGSAQVGAGATRLLLRRRHTIAPGSYVLTLGRGSGRRHEVVTTR